MPYQDIVINGQGVEKGERECASRYNIVRRVASRYTRPFTVIDLGAAEGYFGFALARDFPAVSVMVDDGTRLAALAAQHNIPRTLVLRRRLSVTDLQTLATCEHFDIVLALNVLHHFEDWHGAADAVLHLGDHVIIETPGPDDTGACNQAAVPELHAWLAAKSPPLLGTGRSHTAPVDRPIWHFVRPPRGLTRAYWDVPAGVPLGGCRVDSSWSHKEIVLERKSERRTWLPGINLRTYQRCGGAWPRPADVAAMVQRVPPPTKKHGDIQPWNFILDGAAVHLIDHGDDRPMCDDAEGLMATAVVIQQMDAL